MTFFARRCCACLCIVGALACSPILAGVPVPAVHEGLTDSRPDLMGGLKQSQTDFKYFLTADDNPHNPYENSFEQEWLDRRPPGPQEGYRWADGDLGAVGHGGHPKMLAVPEPVGLAAFGSCLIFGHQALRRVTRRRRNEEEEEQNDSEVPEPCRTDTWLQYE